MTQRIRKAVFPVAGMGTRFLPATKANPKEMLPVVDKPLIQYAAEEAVAAGIEHLIFITGRNKRSIPDHFDKAYELEAELEARGKTEMLRVVRNIVPEHVTCVYIRQTEALGLGHAVGCAEPVVGDEPFAVILADDLIRTGDGSPNVLQQMMAVYEQTGASVLGVEEVPREETHKYGVIKPKAVAERLWEVEGMVEKPRPEEAPSNISAVGRYILTPGIFREIAQVGRGAGNEIQLTDAIVGLLGHEQVMACQFEGQRYDCGSKLGYLEANVEYALSHPELTDDFRAYLKSLHIG